MKKKLRSVFFNIDQEIYKKAKIEAAKRGMYLYQFISSAILYTLANQTERKRDEDV